jgi:hypothetical protein
MAFDINADGAVLVLNAGYEPLHLVSTKHAITMLHRKVAVIEKADRGRFGPYPIPRVLRLLRYISIKWQNRTLPWSRSGTLNRDQHTCAYCGEQGFTIDHILPVSRGGQSTWENTVTACRRCNHRKANRLPNEAGLTLHVTPKAPTLREFHAALATQYQLAL